MDTAKNSIKAKHDGDLLAFLLRNLDAIAGALEGQLESVKAAKQNTYLLKFVVMVGPGVMATGRNLETTITRAIRRFSKESPRWFNRGVHVAIEAEIPGVTSFDVPKSLWGHHSSRVIERLLAKKSRK